MKHYTSLTQAEKQRLAQVYPCTPNRVLCKDYSLSLAGLRMLARSEGWKKDRSLLAAVETKGYKIDSTQAAWLKAHFADTSNSEIMSFLNIGMRALSALAHLYGLKKSHEYRVSTGKKAFASQKEYLDKHDVGIHYTSLKQRRGRRTGTIYQEIQRNMKGREQRGRGSAGRVVRGVGFVKQERIRWVGEITASYKRYRYRSTDYQKVVRWLDVMRNRLEE